MSASEPEPDRDEIEARLAVVRARYGARLDAEGWREVEQVVLAIAKASRALRAVRLTNADAPYPPFSPYRDDPP
jgi:hypothetical protein